MKASFVPHIVQCARIRPGKLKVRATLSDNQAWATVGSRPLHATTR